MSPTPSHYQLLGVSRAASPAEVQRAFRALAKKLHPDVNREPGAGPRFARIAAAYEVLSDEQKRAAYDRSLLQRSAGTSERSASDVAQGHYTWVSVAGAPRPGEPDPAEIDEIYDTFFGSKTPHPQQAEKSSGQGKPKPKRKRAS